MAEEYLVNSGAWGGALRGSGAQRIACATAAAAAPCSEKARPDVPCVSPPGLAYTIVHPGGLIDQEGGRRQLLLGKGDAFMDGEGPRTVPRADVAEVSGVRHVTRAWAGCSACPSLPCGAGDAPPPATLAVQIVVQALLADEALNKSFDVVSRPEGEGEPTHSWEAFFDQATAGL